MRLLDTASLRLVNKREGEVPPYAILSHTWGGEDDEVSFQDIQELSNSRIRKNEGYLFKHPVTKKPGFAKIRDSARLAKSQGYDYIWIDTCCIDKTSSAELSEAINSMFRWYNEAAVCYAFLNDVHDRYYTLASEHDNFSLQQLKEQVNRIEDSRLAKSIQESRWFTRGWTLQELIAPPNVYFYSQTWTLLGSKLNDGPRRLSSINSFSELLSDITGVDVGVLTGSLVLEDLSVASRMKWAAKRQTTRTEDIAYCLMGIFNVNMPLLYGEGTRAFLRLQEEILKVTHDHSIFCWECGENDMLRYQLCGLLALSPTYFQNFGDISPVPFEASLSQSRASAPSTMTNAGLHVQLSLRDMAPDRHGIPGHPKPEGEWYAILDCLPRFFSTAEGGDHLYPAIRLVPLGGDQYGRLYSESVFWVDPAEVDMSERKYIYVKQVPTYGLPEIYLPDHTSNSPSHHSPLYFLTGVHPQPRWSPQTRTLKPDTSRHNSVLGIFRYAVQSSDRASETYTIEVSVGILPGQQGSLSWNCWCYIQPVPNDGLKQWLPVPGLSNQMTSKRNLSTRALTGYDLASIKSRNSNPGRNVRLTDRYVFQNISATVRTTRLRNKTYISLVLSEIYELPTNPVITAPEDPAEWALHLNTFELDADQGSGSGAVGALAVVAATITARDEWQASLGFSLDNYLGRPGPWPIRTVSISQKDQADNFTRNQSWPLLEEVLSDIKTLASDVVIERSERSGETVIEDYFSLLLVKACIKNDLDAVRLFLSSPLSSANIEARTTMRSDVDAFPWHFIFKGFRVLHWATVLGHTDIVRLLLEHEADASSSTGSGLSAVHLAAMVGHSEILNLILDATNHLGPEWFNIHRRADSPAHLAAAYYKGNNLKEILDRLMFPAKVATTTRDSIMAHVSEDAIKHDDPEYFDSDEGHYADVEQEWADVTYNKLNRSGETPLHRAAAMDNLAAAEIILGYNREGFHPLSTKDSFGRTPLWHAAAVGSEDVVRLFLEHDPDLEVKDPLGRTPLHAACRGGHWIVAESLLAAGANAGAITETHPFTAYHFAALGGNSDILQTLIKHQIVAMPSATAITLDPIHIAAANGFARCVKVLCQAGCDIEVKATHRLLVNAPGSSLGVMITTVTNGTPEQLAMYGSYFSLAGYIRSVREDRETLENSLVELSLGLRPERPVKVPDPITRAPLNWEFPDTVPADDDSGDSPETQEVSSLASEPVFSPDFLPIPQDTESFSSTIFPFLNGDSDGNETPKTEPAWSWFGRT